MYPSILEIDKGEGRMMRAEHVVKHHPESPAASWAGPVFDFGATTTVLIINRDRFVSGIS